MVLMSLSHHLLLYHLLIQRPSHIMGTLVPHVDDVAVLAILGV